MMQALWTTIKENVPRMWEWVVITLMLLVAIWVVSPQQFSVVVYKGAIVCLAVCVSYWVDRSMFRYAPDGVDEDLPRDNLGAARLISRALIFVGTMLGLTLGI